MHKQEQQKPGPTRPARTGWDQGGGVCRWERDTGRNAGSMTGRLELDGTGEGNAAPLGVSGGVVIRGRVPVAMRQLVGQLVVWCGPGHTQRDDGRRGQGTLAEAVWR